MFHKLVQSGLFDVNGAALPLIQESKQSAPDQSQATDRLTNQLLDNVFDDFSCSSSDLQDTA
ncbi:hypothetical protein AB4Y40_34250 [Paraburkholderia sp. EG287B]|uniref:hypothetical protein n=1 Tax=Paraburkholderia sp. EG287B TaxID=3237010 RepID=UPI0034D2552D